MKGYPSGNLTVQLEFKKKQQRHSFRWLLKHIATEVLEKYAFSQLSRTVIFQRKSVLYSPIYCSLIYCIFNLRFPAPPANVYWGQMVNAGTGLCVDTVGQGVGGGPIGLSTCQYVQVACELDLRNITTVQYTVSL